MKKPIMMQGTDGNMDYLLFARKGIIGIGLKPNVIMEGKVAGTTYIGARIRSAMLPQGAIPENDIPNIAHLKLGLQDAWPGVTWEKQDAKRASTQVGILLRGTPKHNPEALLQEFGADKLPTKMADYLVGLVGIENLTLDREDIIAWLVEFYAPIVKKISKMVEVEKAYDKELEESVGSFAMAADILKKVYQTTQQPSGDDVPDFSDEDSGDDHADEEGED